MDSSGSCFSLTLLLVWHSKVPNLNFHISVGRRGNRVISIPPPPPSPLQILPPWQALACSFMLFGGGGVPDGAVQGEGAVQRAQAALVTPRPLPPPSYVSAETLAGDQTASGRSTRTAPRFSFRPLITHDITQWVLSTTKTRISGVKWVMMTKNLTPMTQGTPHQIETWMRVFSGILKKKKIPSGQWEIWTEETVKVWDTKKFGNSWQPCLSYVSHVLTLFHYYSFKVSWIQTCHHGFGGQALRNLWEFYDFWNWMCTCMKKEEG